MQLDYFSPTPAMRDLFTVHFAMDGLKDWLVERVPALVANVHIRLSGATRYRFQDGRVQDAPAVSLLGPTSASFEMAVAPGTRLLGIGMLPLGWRRCMGEGAHRFADLLVPGDALWSAALLERTLDQLAAARLDGGHVQIVEALLASRLRSVSCTDLARIQAIDSWIEGQSSPGIEHLASMLGLGARQTARLALDLHGAAPKLVAMKYRALRCASQLTSGSLDDVAALTDRYADQSHLTRDFRRFVGWTPAAFVRDRRALARATLKGRLDAGLSRPMALWS